MMSPIWGWGGDPITLYTDRSVALCQELSLIVCVIHPAVICAHFLNFPCTRSHMNPVRCWLSALGIESDNTFRRFIKFA